MSQDKTKKMSKSKKRKKILIWGGIIVVIILVVLALTKKGKDHGTKVTTEEVNKRTLIETVSANGKIQPELDIKISPYISGEVVELYVKEGDAVIDGDLLAKIDPKIYISGYERATATLQMQKASLANSKARLAQVKAQFSKAQEDYKRNNKLFEQSVISQSDFDAAKSAYEVAKEEVNAAEENVKAARYSVNSSEASLKEAKENLTRTSIYSPADGTVSTLNVEKGERVTGASQFSSGTEIMKIANLKRMVVVVEVNENDIVRVSLGDTCIIEVDAYLNKKFEGVVTEMATSANVVGVSADQVTNFEVKILILQNSYQDMIDESKVSSSPFRPGMSASVDIQTETGRNVLTVPIQAVTTRADTTGVVKEKEMTDSQEEEKDVISKEKMELVEYVFLFDEGKAIMQKVKTGIQDDMYIQIIEGLNEGDEVITGPYRAVSKKLKNGDEVIKVEKKDLFKKEK